MDLERYSVERTQARRGKVRGFACCQHFREDWGRGGSGALQRTPPEDRTGSELEGSVTSGELPETLPLPALVNFPFSVPGTER